jgi:tetratricopeptide (TPR) repeat protein
LERFRLKKIILILLLFNSSFVLADQKDSRLNSLFDELYLSNDNMQASTILADIWDIWSIAENVEAQKIFDEGNKMMDRGSLEEAIALFTQVIDLKPDFAEGWNKRATVLFLKGELEASISDIQKTLELEPRHFGALDGLAEIYLIQDDLLGAAATYKRILEIIPTSKKSQDRLKLINDLIV